MPTVTFPDSAPAADVLTTRLLWLRLFGGRGDSFGSGSSAGRSTRASRRPPFWPWAAAGLDVLVLASEPDLASALDQLPAIRAMVSLGGHPQVVQAVALSSLLILVVLAPLTEGYRNMTITQRGVLALAGMLAIVAGVGGLTLLLLSPFVLAAYLLIKIPFR